MMHLALRSGLWFWSKQLRKYREGVLFQQVLCRGYFLIERLLDYFTTESRLVMSGPK